jgi:hypothetical protein
MPRPKNARRSSGRWLIALLAVFSLTMLLAAACGGSGDSDGSDNGATATPTATQTPGDQTATPAATQTPSDGDETPTPTDTPDDDGTDSDDLSQELQDLASKWTDQTAKVSYDFSSEGAGEDFSGTMTLYWRFPDWRLDMSGSDLGDVTMIATEDSTAVCTEGTCLAIANSDSAIVPVPPFVGDFTDPDVLTSSIAGSVLGVEIDSFQETIAGESADCFSASGSVEGESGSTEWCFTDDGILLRSFSTFEEDGETGEFRLEATTVSRDVSDADFEPPYPVTEFNLP